ncbi:ABC transporter ATP-binding protein [Nocardioides stalactiti]|uniref:ABC transporter ATP-binding protein n=1 Tax=Nocardioides stalactiti TaxID=2755356 RepID=UPI0015FFC1DF|nr:ABC transporter ATP-binding protein [Nocardioides stalactiti]
MRLEIKGLTKKFGSFTANDGIDLVIEPGEIHCLLGENGAGKSTLMNMLYGLLTPTSGEILLDGKPVSFGGPGDALAAGIGMVHQHFMLVPVFTVAENVMLGHEQTYGGGVLNRRAARKQVRELSDRYGLKVDPDAYVEDIPVGVQQRVEILKALASHAQVLILDEPTAVLTPQEIDELMGIMRELKAQGTSIIFITHKLREVKAIGDKISVIRRGKVVGTAEPSASEAELAEMMVGRSVSLVVSKDHAEVGAPVLKAEGITVIDPRGHVVVKDVSFEARGGEILGIAGVQGNGQTELIKSLLGLIKPDAGRIELAGRDISKHGPRQSLEEGIGYVPEDRSHDGYVGSFSVRENLVLDLYRSDEFSRGPALRLDAISANAKARIEEFDIRTENAETPVAALSGGNQQKVVVAREFSRPLKVLIASQPTRGVDVGSIEFIHKRIVAERDRGTAVIIVSTELEEIYALADRIAVMYDGRIVATVPPDIPRADLGLLMAGATPGGSTDGSEVAS